MAKDDVKIGFGGDFSNVQKGATEAADAAGTALTKTLEGKIKAVGGAIAGMFAVGAIASKVWEGFKEGLSYLHDLNLAMTRTGQSSAEFQKLAYAGKEAGVSMDVVGRGLTEANKALERAKSNKDFRNTLVNLGLDAEGLEKGTVTATDALLALAGQWDKFGNAQKTRAGAVALFGRWGEAMIPVIQQGRSAIEEQTASVHEHTRAEIIGAAAIEKKLAALERYTKQMERMSAAKAGLVQVESDFASQFDEAKRLKRQNPDKYYEQYGDQTPGQVAVGKMQKEYKEKYGVNPEEFNIIFQQAFKGMSATGAFKENFAEAQRLSDEYLAAKNKPSSRPVEELAGALAASSIQAIGGGDVASVLSGTYQNEMLEQTRRIADNTTPRENAHAQQPVARAGK